MNRSEIVKFLACRGNEVQEIHLGLHRTQAMMEALGNPQEDFPVIHIAGTNGKGSVAAMSESILRHAGWTTGLYTSPHLVRVEERIRVNSRQVSAQAFAALVSGIRATEAELIKKRVLDRSLSLFEFLTVCAFSHFAESGIDVAIVEAGMGGMLDATNVVKPSVSVITEISLDHENFLGNTLTKIAKEKAGIIKPLVPVVSGCCHATARRVVRNRARAVAAPVFDICQDCVIRIKTKHRGRCSIDLRTPRREYGNLRISLAGEHQTRNAALAVMAAETLDLDSLRAQDVRMGLAHTLWPGRLDEYHRRRRTLLDGAHNPDGARVLRDFLLNLNKADVHLVFGALRDKNIRKMGAYLFPLARSVHLARLSNSRSADPLEIASMHGSLRDRFRVHHSAREALNAAWDECSRAGLVVVAGSLYLVGELLPVLRRLSSYSSTL